VERRGAALRGLSAGELVVPLAGRGAGVVRARRGTGESAGVGQHGVDARRGPGPPATMQTPAVRRRHRLVHLEAGMEGGQRLGVVTVPGRRCRARAQRTHAQCERRDPDQKPCAHVLPLRVQPHAHPMVDGRSLAVSAAERPGSFGRLQRPPRRAGRIARTGPGTPPTRSHSRRAQELPWGVSWWRFAAGRLPRCEAAHAPCTAEGVAGLWHERSRP
jgi:hypothetical protein